MDQDIPLVSIAGHPARIFEHPEIGWVLWDNAGAAGNVPFSAYQDDRDPPAIVTQLNGPAHERGEPGAFDTALASDGWWWRLLRPYAAIRIDGQPLAD